MNATRRRVIDEDPRASPARELRRVTCDTNPFRSVDVGAEFCVPQGVNNATRNADYYRRKYKREFSCSKVPAELGVGTIVRRIR